MADKKARQQIELTGEQKYRAALKNIANDMKGVSAQQALLNSQYDKGDASIAKMSQQHELLGKKLKAQKDRLKLIEDEIKRTSAAEGENSDRVRQLKNEYAYAQRDINNTERAMQQLGDEMAQASKKTEQLRARLREAGIELPTLSEAADKVGTSLTKAISAPIAALGVASGKLYLDYEKQLYTVATIADETVMSMDELSAAMITASNNSGMAATEVAQATYGAISAGVNTAEAASFVEKAAKAAKGGLTDVTTAVDGATSAINAWGLGYENAESVFDKFIIAQNLGKTTLGDLASQIGNLTGIAPQVGVSLEEVLAATAALTKNGVQTSTAMNGLKAVMSAVIKPTGEAAEVAKKLGLNFSAEALRDKGFTDFLSDVIQKTGGSEEALSKLFGSVEGLSQVMLLAGSGADDYAEALAAMGDSAGAMQAAFDKVTGSNLERMSLSINKIKNAGINVGATLSPAFEAFSNVLEDAATWLSTLNAEQITNIVTWGASLAAIGPVITAVGKATTAVKGLGKAFKAAKVLFAGGGGVGLAIAGVTAGIVALVAAVSKLSQRTLGIDKLKATVDAIDLDEESISTAATTAMNALEPLTIYAKDLVDFQMEGQSLIDEFSDNFGVGKEHYLTAQEVTSFRESVAAWVGPLIEAGKGAVDAETQKLGTALEAASTAYQSYAIQLARQNRDPVEAEIAQLEALRQKVIDIGASIAAATNEAATAAELAWIKTTRGEGTVQDAAMAAVYAQSKKAGAEYANEKTMRPLLYEAEKRVVAAHKSGDEAAYQQATAELVALQEQNAANQAEINATYAQSMEEVMAGLAQKYPEQMETLRRVDDMAKATQEAIALLNSDEEFEGDWAATVNALVQRITGGKEDYAGMPSALKLDTAVNEASTYIDGVLSGVDVSGLMESFYAMVQSGMLDALDPATLSEDMGALLTMVDLKDDAKTIGQQWAAGEVEGIEGSQAEVNAAIIEHCKSIIDAAMQAMEIKSPSRKAMELMDYWGQGEVLGLQAAESPLRAALTQHLGIFSAQNGVMYQAGASMMGSYVAGMLSQLSAYNKALQAFSGGGSGNGGTPVLSRSGGSGGASVTVNYTGGVSARDSQRLGQQLGQYLKNHG